MSSDPSLAIQKAFYDKLIVAVPLVSGRVYDQVPEPDKLSYPFISFGEFQTVDDSADCIDSTELFATLHSWSRKFGSVEIKQIVDQVRMALHDQALDLGPNFNWVLSENETSRILKDPDGVTHHGVTTIRVVSTAR